MAVREVRTCDFELKNGVCGKEATERVFAVDRNEYVIDLCDEHRSNLIKVLTPYTEAGRTTKAVARRAGARKSAGVPVAAVRAWLQEQGIAVNDRGRIPTKLVDQYLAANGGLRAAS